MRALRCREVFAVNGIALAWRTTMEYRYLDMESLRVFHERGILAMFKQENLSRNIESMADIGVAASKWVNLPSHHLDRDVVQQLLCAKGQWLNSCGRYPELTSSHLAFAFIDMITAKMDLLTNKYFATFLEQLCLILQNANNNRTRLAEIIQLMIALVVANSEMSKDTVARSQNPEQPRTQCTFSTDGFFESMFTLLASEQLEPDTLHAAWKLLQVLSIYCVVYCLWWYQRLKYECVVFITMTCIKLMIPC